MIYSYNKVDGVNYLPKAIHESIIFSSISVQLSGVTAKINTIDIEFIDALNALEKTELDSIFNNHESSNEYKKFYISRKSIEIDSHRDFLLNQGVLYNGQFFDADDRSQNILDRAHNLGKSYESLNGQGSYSVPWIRKDNQVQIMGLYDLLMLGFAMGGLMETLAIAARTHKNNLQNLTVDEINNYDYSSGWL